MEKCCCVCVSPVLIPQRCNLDTVTLIATRDIHTANQVVLRGTIPRVLEVEVWSVKETVAIDHPALELQGEGLSADQQARVTALLRKWTHVFAAHEDDFGDTKAVKHHIATGEAPPIRDRYRLVPPKLFAELRELLQEMVDNKVVWESSSPWAAPVVLVHKKDGTWRFCVDYRKLNAVTHKDAYPLPRIEESLMSLTRATWYSTLDLASGYWEVEVAQEDKEKTAFTMPLRLYEFERMPFGLCNAPATFQRLMQRCLGEQVHDHLLIYLDDVIVYSPDFESHLRHLEQVFQRLQEHGLKLQPVKCRLFRREVRYLGHVVSGQRVATDTKKTRAVADWPVPTTARQVKSFLGFVGYNRRFISGFAKMAAPLTHLLQGTTGRPSATVTWSPACQLAFDQLKQKLLDAPILASVTSHIALPPAFYRVFVCFCQLFQNNRMQCLPLTRRISVSSSHQSWNQT